MPCFFKCYHHDLLLVVYITTDRHNYMWICWTVLSSFLFLPYFHFKAYCLLHWNSISFQGLSIIIVRQVFYSKYHSFMRRWKNIDRIVGLCSVHTRHVTSYLFSGDLTRSDTSYLCLISLVLSVLSTVLTF